MDAPFSCFFLLEQVESNVAQDSEVFGRLVFADSAVIFVQSDIQDPMQIIFNRPVLAHNVEQAFCITGQTRNIEAHPFRFLAVNDPCGNNHGNTSQSQPVFPVTDEVEIFRVGSAPTFPHLKATTPALAPQVQV